MPNDMKRNLTMLTDFYEITMSNGYFQYELEDRKHQEDLEKQNGNGSEETMPE